MRLALMRIGSLPTNCPARRAPLAQLNRAIAIGEADGPVAGLAALATVDPGLPRHTAASAHLYEKAGDLRTAARLYAGAARCAPYLAERHHLTRQAVRLSQALRG
jgi:predicted RNA polymerase sigma factor